MNRHQNPETPSGQIEFSFLWRIFRASLVSLLIVAFLCAGVAGVFRYVTTTPTYTSQVTLYVNAANGTTAGDILINPGNTTSARDLAETFGKVIQSRGVVDYVLEDLQNEFLHGKAYKDLTFEGVRAMMTVTVDTQIITLKITHPDAKTAFDIAKAFENEIPGRLDYYVGIVNESGTEEVASVTKLMDKAELDKTPSSRGTLLFATVGFLLGAVVVYLIYFLQALFDNTVYTEEDLKPYFTAPVIGQIPTWTNGNEVEQKRRRKRQLPDGGVSTRDYSGRLLCATTPFAIAEAFKMLRTNMCYTTKGETCAVYGVTSAYVGAGKSILMANTAISFAQMGKRVLLIDGDLRCPVQHKIFSLDPKTHGLSELLAGVCQQEEDVIRPSGIEHLDIITSGRIPPNPAELLASGHMKALIAYAKEHYDVVFIDLPPICEVTDAGVISDLVTGYTFVIRSAYTDRRLVTMAVETMESLGASIIGFVLNDIDIKSGDYYKNKYYHNYGSHGKYGKYGHYSKYRTYGRQGYHYGENQRYGYTDEELSAEQLERTSQPTPSDTQGE